VFGTELAPPMLAPPVPFGTDVAPPVPFGTDVAPPVAGTADPPPLPPEFDPPLVEFPQPATSASASAPMRSPRHCQRRRHRDIETPLPSSG